MSSSFPTFPPFALFERHECIRLHVLCLDAKRFQAMPMGGERDWVYDTCNVGDLLSSVGGCLERWMH